ncbi:MAG TPA: hypothetical protein VHE30_02495 [Polyangiaceae bacterium]|nr:hypothetical protein [Polyangiaceae bacterium]
MIEGSRRRALFPRALFIALTSALLLSFGTWLVAVDSLRTAAKTVLLLGDSNVANFRLLEGDRLEDRLGADLGPGWVVRNWGEVGADPADQYLALCRAETLRFHPDVVVLVLSPHAFIPDTTNWGHRLRENGDGLRWIPWNAEGYRFFGTLSPDEKKKAVVRAVDPIFGFYDGYLAWNAHSDWPRLRREMAARSPELQTIIVHEYSRLISKWLDEHLDIGAYEDFAARPNARDFGFFTEAVTARKIPFLTVVLPEAAPDVLSRSFSEKTRATLETSYAYTVRYLSEHHAEYLDYNTPVERTKFDASMFGDHYHLKSPAAYRYLADGVAAWIGRRTQPRGT